MQRGIVSRYIKSTENTSFPTGLNGEMMKSAQLVTGQASPNDNAE